MNLEEFAAGAELHAYAPGHDGPFEVGAAVVDGLVRFVDSDGTTVLEGPARAEDYSMCGLVLHPWGVCADWGPCVAKGGAADAAAVCRFLAGLDGRKGVLTRQLAAGTDYLSPTGPYTSEVVTVGESDRAVRPGLYALYGADGERVMDVCGGSFRVDSRGTGLRGHRGVSAGFTETMTLLFPDAEPVQGR